ncbi:MAG: hypothetical protein SCH71_04690 [Desulfobulbaceae bacterium]|nr:hypothetical protein [Desulfobulbaceae bacterium]
MGENLLTISQTRLERAKKIDEGAWLNSTFNKAAKVIGAGGKVKIMQPFTHSSTEMVAIIDTMEMLDYYKKMYLNK